MPSFYEMPAVSPTMEVGTIVAWRVAEGQSFESGTVLAEIGTDKANMDAEIFERGVLLKHLASEGDELPPGAPIAIWGKAGDDIGPLLAELASRTAPSPAAPAPAPVAAVPAPDPAPVAAAPAPAPTVAPSAALPAGGTIVRTWMGRALPADFQDPPGDIQAAAPRVSASPLARKVAADLGIALSAVRGSGPNGRVVRADVEAVAARPAPAAPAPVGPVDETVRLSPMRKTIARRLTAVHQEVPVFQLTVSWDGAEMVRLRDALKRAMPDAKVSYNDMVIAACGRALRAFPKANAGWGEAGIVRYGRVDVGVAVAVDDGLITPVIKGADHLGLAEIGARMRELAGRARDGKLAPDEYTGGTFTISNLGMFDIEHFTAILNPPAAAILAVGRLAQVPVVVDGALTVGWRMNATLTCDHRVIDGATGAQFLQVLRRYIETPALLAV
jgi:pyruvate dehydrogenase E2 component (dihydrolipoamide acetyltransferase)